MRKVLVSYFSASGVTKGVAEKVATAINGDLFEIEPVVKYSNKDLDWTDKNSNSWIQCDFIVEVYCFTFIKRIFLNFKCSGIHAVLLFPNKYSVETL